MADVHVGPLVFGALCLIATFGVAARWLRLPYPIVFVIGGALLAFVPGLPRIELKPDIVFLLFLPPLLHGGGFTTEWRDFKQYFVPIMMLAVGLVIATTVAVAYVAHTFFAMPLAVAFVLGAIVSPSDAVATEALAQDLRLPRPIKAILSGESLLNDASALVIYAFAVAAVTSGTFSLGAATIQFFYVSLAGVTVGVLAFRLLSSLLGFLRGRGLADGTISILFSLITPYVVYLFADGIHASGVLAAVTTGILTGRHLSDFFDVDARIASVGVWTLLIFTFNAVLFLLIGIELRFILGALHEFAPLTLFAYAALASATVITVRFAWIWFLTPLRRRVLPSGSGAHGQRWHGRFVVAWSGMRGIVTLAAALSIPTLDANGAPFPFRNLILFIAFGVIVVTLVGQGLTLPFFIRTWKVTTDEDPQCEIARARLAAAQAGLDHLRDREAAFATAAHADIAGRIRSYYENRMTYDRSKTTSPASTETSDGDASVLFREMWTGAYDAERAALLALRLTGQIGDDTYRQLEWGIDLAVSRLT